MSDKKFIDGLIVKAPNEGAPDYVKARLSIKREELIAWLQKQTGEWINADVKESQGGKYYAAVDDWKPEGRGGGPVQTRGAAPARRSSPAAPTDGFEDEDVPFGSNRGLY